MALSLPTYVPRRFSAQALSDRKSTRLNSSHTEIYTLSLHDALPICSTQSPPALEVRPARLRDGAVLADICSTEILGAGTLRSEEHTSELQSHRDLHSFPTRRSSDLQYAEPARTRSPAGSPAGWRCPCRHMFHGDSRRRHS